jgi:hypothetical protein
MHRRLRLLLLLCFLALCSAAHCTETVELHVISYPRDEDLSNTLGALLERQLPGIARVKLTKSRKMADYVLYVQIQSSETTASAEVHLAGLVPEQSKSLDNLPTSLDIRSPSGDPNVDELQMNNVKKWRGSFGGVGSTHSWTQSLDPSALHEDSLAICRRIRDAVIKDKAKNSRRLTPSPTPLK